MTYIFFLVLGLGNGCVFAGLALGLVLAYRSSGVVNFAAGGLALYGAYNYSLLIQGQLLSPLPFTPKSYALPYIPSQGLAIAWTVAITAALGALLYLLVFRPLRSAPAAAKAVAALGVMLVIPAVMAAKVGTSAVVVPRIFPEGTVRMGDQQVDRGILWFTATIGVITVALVAIDKWTKFGLATRAAAESERGAILTGLSPQRLAVANWAIAGGVAGLMGVLISPLSPVVPTQYTFYVVPALAAALIAGFSSYTRAATAALAIGALESVAIYFMAQHQVTWLTAQAVVGLVPLVLILAYLVVAGRPLPGRGAIVLQTLGRAPRSRRLLLSTVVGSALGAFALIFTSGSIRGSITTSMILAVIALSMVVVTGYAGQISLAQVTLAGVSAFALSRITMDLNVPFPLAPLLAALAATVVGVVVGLPALRVRGLPVAIATLALAVFIHGFWFVNSSLTNGGDTRVATASLFGLDLSVGEGKDQARLGFSFLCLIVLVAVALGVALLRRSRTGAAMLAVRANEKSAAASGISVVRTKITAFAIASFIAGIGGALYAYQQTRANEPPFNPIVGLALFATVYLAGITSVSGALLAGIIGAGGVLYTALANHFSLGTWYEAITAILLVVTVIMNPEGAMSPFHRLAERLNASRRPATTNVESLAIPLRTRSSQTGEDVALQVQSVTVRYGSVVAVDNVTLDVKSGTMIGLIGPNGAGKTTLLDVLSGLVPATQGIVSLRGRELTGLKPHHRARLGVSRTFQGLDLYEDLTVRENVLVGESAVETSDSTTGRATVDEICGFLGLTQDLDRSVTELSQGHRQLVSIARALAGQPDVLLLDEPAAGLDSSDSQWLGEHLRRIRDSGVTIVMIDHDMDLVLSFCDSIFVLNGGKLLASGTPNEIRVDAGVKSAYLGASAGTAEAAT